MNMNVSLTEEQEEFVKSRISTGQYSSASEVVSEALRLMERHELTEATKLKWLQEAYAVGIASGDAGELDFNAVKAEARRLLLKDVR
jgi:antitoxin ParD1/3/4